MNKPYDLAVVIGRFQPLHNGHLALFERAIDIAHYQMVLIGSSFIARNIKNPFSFEERETFVFNEFYMKNKDPHYHYDVAGITDDAYNDQQWVASVQSEVERAKKKFGIDGPNARVVLVGHTKDASSYYLKMFPSYAYEEVSPVDVLDATDIRDQFFGEKKAPQNIPGIPNHVREFLSKFSKTKTYIDLCDEHKAIKDYRAKFKDLEYPPVFVTCDAVVICNGHILLVKRRSHPGKGLWALPGGFINQNERIIDGIIRELEEETRIKVSHDLLKANLKGTHVFDAPNRSLRGRTITNAGLIILNNLGELPVVRGSDDAERAKWFPISYFYQMSDRLFEDHYSIGTYMINRAG